MNRSLPHVPPLRAPLLSAMLLASSLLGGCGGSSGDGSDVLPGTVFADEDEPGAGESTPDDPGGDAPGGAIELPAPLRALASDPDSAAFVPEVVEVETLADSGLQVAYTESSQRARIEPLRVGAQWQHMQSCVEVVGAPPLVLIRTEVDPLAVTDDVIRDFEGRITATGSEFVDGMAILQVRDASFDGSHADAGFGLLRQIMGRHLWLSSGRLERDYPSECAREVPSESASDTLHDLLLTEI